MSAARPFRSQPVRCSARVPLALLALAAGCGGGSVSDGSGGGGGPAGSGGVGGGQPGSGGAGLAPAGSGGAPGTGGSIGFTLECSKPNLGSPILRLMTGNEIQNTLNDVFPEVKGQWTATLPAKRVSGYGFDNDASITVGKQLASALVDTALSVATAVTGNPLAGLLPCSTNTADRACAEQFLTRYGRRLFRRPVTQAERDRYLGFFEASRGKSDFKTALKWMTVGLIQSPNAIYRSEIGTDKGDGTRPLTTHEIATALSYTFAGSTPSETLLAQADSGNLGDIPALARSLAGTDPGKQMLQRFFEGYLGYSAVESVQRPNVSSFAAVSADMARETRAFIDDVIIQRRGGVKELLTAPTTNPSQALASYYGFPAPGANYATVIRPAGRGLGILAQGSFLTSHASPDSSSPTLRGLFPYLKLLCEKKLNPPPNVTQLSAPQPGQKTTRQRYEDVHAKVGAACGFCHQKFDPPGFAFEHFDEAGRYRANEGGLPIDSSGNMTKADGTVLFSFKGQEDLVTNLANQPVAHQCLAAYLATYAFGTDEACLGSSKVPDLQSGAIGIADAFTQLAAEPHFTRRNVQ